MNKKIDKFKLTEAGLFTADNVKYLLEQNILTVDKKTQTYAIKFHRVNNGEIKDLLSWSLYRWVYEDIVIGSKVTDPEAVINIMRKGCNITNYPRVENVIKKGISLALQKKAR